MQYRQRLALPIIKVKNLYQRRKVEQFLRARDQRCTDEADAEFEQLLLKTPPRKISYGYTPLEIWERASSRCRSLLKLGELSTPGKTVLDIGCGEGMIGAMLSTYGHTVTMIDQEDWRCESAKDKKINFVLSPADANEMPFPKQSFDLIFSYNVFEHLRRPDVCFQNLVSLLRPSGILLLSAGPLYASAWGYHAYRAVPVPYCQFLFSKELLDKKIQEIGVRDLGRDLDEPQSLNGWRWSQFQSLFESAQGCKQLFTKWNKEYSWLSWVARYPNSFCGLGLQFEDLVISAFHVALKKTEET